MSTATNENKLRHHAEQQFAEELEELKKSDARQRPANWELSPWAVCTYLLGGELDNGFTVSAKYIGNRRIIETAVATLATDRALLLYGVPGTAKSWVSEHLAAAISGDSTRIIQGTAGTSEEQMRYGWNYAELLSKGPSRAALVESPLMRAMSEGRIARVEELTRIPADVQDTLLAGLACALCFSGLFSMERRGGMETILCTTPLGRKRTVRAKLAVSAGVAVLIAAASCLPHLIQVLRDYGLPALFAPAMSISEFESLPALFTLSDVLLFWFVCRIAACLCMGAITLTLGRVFGNLLPALFVSAVGYCLPALLSLSGMDGGIEWLGFSPLFHAAALWQTQGGNTLWVPIFLACAAFLLAWAIGQALMDEYDMLGVPDEVL